MLSVAVEKMVEPGEADSPILREIDELFGKIRQEAFEIFQKNGSVHGHDVDHWLEAERVFLCCPAVELIEKDKEFQISLAVSGFDTEDIRVIALPDAIIVMGRVRSPGEREQEATRISETNEKQLFRRVELPEIIDVNSVSTRISPGLLEVVAKKAVASNKTARAM